jgi:hypothetical protein
VAASIYSRTLQKAAELIGGRDKLCRHLQVPTDVLAAWIDDKKKPPVQAFLRAVDLVLDETPVPGDAEPADPSAPRDCAASGDSSLSGWNCRAVRRFSLRRDGFHPGSAGRCIGKQQIHGLQKDRRGRRRRADRPGHQVGSWHFQMALERLQATQDLGRPAQGSRLDAVEHSVICAPPALLPSRDSPKSR